MLIHGITDNDIHPPVFGASQRTFGLARGLARRHDVRMLCVVPNRNRAAEEERVAHVTLLRRRAWYTSVAWRLARAGVMPMAVAATGHRRFARALLRALPGSPDVRMADLLVSPLLEPGEAGLRVYTAHNVEADHVRASAPDGAVERWAARVRRLEARAIAAADLVVVCTGEDGERMRALYGVPDSARLVVPNGWDETRIRPPANDDRARARAKLGLADGEIAGLFLGSDVPHNREALDWLATSMMPALAADGVRLLVAGSVSRALGGRSESWLRLLPETDDLLPILHAADVGLNPVARGGGSNVKLPTYLAAGLAVVTTPHGLRGYPRLARLVTAVERDGFADAVRAAGRAQRRADAASSEVAELAWGSLGERMGEAFAAVLESRRSGEPPGAREAGA